MEPSNNENDGCPLGESGCERLAELRQARVQIADLSSQIGIDGLTGLYNYRHFLRAAEQELERTRRNGQPTALIMVDLDHFKQVNDLWGHQVGNLVLRRCAALMQQTLRKIDIPCRYGGEEFALLLPATDLPHAVNAAERLRQGIQQLSIEVGAESFSVTASMGISLCRNGENLTPGELVERADAFLYQAKRKGRNRVCHAEFHLVRPRGEVGRDEKDELLKP